MKYVQNMAVLIAVIFFPGAMLYEPEYIIELPHTLVIYKCEREGTNPVPPRRNVPEKYRQLFDEISEAVGIPHGVLESIAFVESDFDPQAMSPPRENGRQDLGMFQFNNTYLTWYADRYNSGLSFDPMVPEDAAPIAGKHIRYLYERYEHWPTVCLAYNAGMSAVDNEKVPDCSYRYLAKIYEEL
jgi:soluble lytic murein transglycosylase-like protein